jgi:sterol desaturase/sphingolipid hydroxylase (fatty acid hydroxylase superfamily)
MNFLKIMSNWFGLNNGKLIGEPPAYVDKEKIPGMSPIPKPSILSWIQHAPFVLITSPNFVWANISLLIYFYKPYDLTVNSLAYQSPISSAFFYDRFPLWFSLVFGYDSFWHISLYFFNLGSRPFIPNRKYNIDKVIHNIFWTTSGIIIWTGFENVFCYLWATNRLSYIHDSYSVYTLDGGFRFLLALMAIPLWRSFHFYFAHRLLHYGPLYIQAHSLHHRNTDVEPFSGLCMHPVEHLYYYSCILPSLLFLCSPFAFLWNGVHLLLSPGASHSGYEDHFQSDAYHYMHHRYFECNYAGTDAAFMDIAFGTFKESFSEEDMKDGPPKPRDDAKSSLRNIPTNEFIRYIILSFISVGVWLYYSNEVSKGDIIINKYNRISISSLAGFGPVIIAWILTNLFNSGGRVQPVKMNIFGNLLHLGMGTLFCSIPITYMCYLAL